jgi:hypothetical protein
VDHDGNCQGTQRTGQGSNFYSDHLSYKWGSAKENSRNVFVAEENISTKGEKEGQNNWSERKNGVKYIGKYGVSMT